MRRFSSYGPVDPDLHYYAPRKRLVEQMLHNLLGEDPSKQGGYVTIWGPRQSGKTWIKGRVLQRLRLEHPAFDVVSLNVEHLQTETDTLAVMRELATEIALALRIEDVGVDRPSRFARLFSPEHLGKPLILLIDEFDALSPDAINAIVGVFRNICISRQEQAALRTGEKDHLLHGVALVGVRSVLGAESRSGSPFNVQRSLRIPNLTFDEVRDMFAAYQRDSGQAIKPDVVRQLYAETRGQPGLTSWLGELLTETGDGRLNPDQDVSTGVPELALAHFERVYSDAINALPNAAVLHILAKVRAQPYRDLVLGLFETAGKRPFRFDEPHIGSLYMNGVIDRDTDADGRQWIRFACPLLQKRLFNYFSFADYAFTGDLHGPFDDVSDTITETTLDVRRLLRRFETHVRENRAWLLKDAPRRADLRVYEAVFHFVLYSYLTRFVQRHGGTVLPEFPTGNGKIDLLIRHAGRRFGLEVKSYGGDAAYRKALEQAAQYGDQLGLHQITLAVFVDAIDEASRVHYERLHSDQTTGVLVDAVFVATGA